VLLHRLVSAVPTCAKVRRPAAIIREGPILNQKGYEGAALSDFMRATRLEKGGVYRHLGGAQVPAGEAIAEEGQRLGEVRSDGCRHLEEYLDTDIRAKGFGVRAGRP
jgi:AcrR family transcriptional regulator